jgi:hypothetical protein
MSETNIILDTLHAEDARRMMVTLVLAPDIKDGIVDRKFQHHGLYAEQWCGERLLLGRRLRPGSYHRRHSSGALEF